MTEDIKTKLTSLLKSDINALIKGIKDLYEPFGQSFRSSEGELKSFSIDFKLFINLVNEYCFKDSILFSENFVNTFDGTSFSKDFQNIIKKNEILKERLKLFKKLFTIPFTLIQIASNHNTISTSEISIVGLYYLFFYQVFNDYAFKKIEIKEILDTLLDQWQNVLDNQTILVTIRVEMDTIILQDDLNFNEQFQLILTNHSHIERFNPFSSKIYIPYCLIYKTEIHFKKYYSNESYQRNIGSIDSWVAYNFFNIIRKEPKIDKLEELIY